MVTLNVVHRSTDGLVFLDETQNQFNVLMHTSIVTDRDVNRKLMQIDDDQINNDILLSSPNNSPRRDSHESSL